MTILYEDKSTVNVGHEVTPFTASKREAHDLEQYQAETSKAPTKRQLAYYWRKQGYSIIPVPDTRDKEGRKPLVKWTPFQTNYASLDEFNGWWDKWPDANPSIVTGELSEVIALDIDGIEGLEWLKAQGELPPTRVVSRGAKGRYHFWYKHPGFQVRNTNLHAQVEVKGDGGLIPCPGATHWSGATYKIVRDFPVADCPQWLIALLKPPPLPPAEPHKQRHITGNDERAYLERRAQRWLDKRVNDLASRPPGDHFGPFKALAYYAGWYASPNNRLLTEQETWNGVRGALESNGYLRKHGERTTQAQFRHYWQRGQEMPGQPESLMRAVDWWRQKNRVQVKDDFTVLAASPEPHPQTIGDQASPQPAAQWPNGVPFTVRATFSQYANSAIAPVIELVNEAHTAGLLKTDEWFDAGYLFCIGGVLGRNLSEATIRRALNQGREQFFEILHPVLYRSLESESKNESSGGMESEERGTSNCKKPGRKKHLYRLQPKAVMFKNLLELAAPEIIKKSFPTNGGIIAPIHESFLRELGLSADDAKRVHGELNAKFKPFLDNQPGFQPALERARAEFKRTADSLNDERATPIRAGWTYRTTGDYAICCARALLDSNGGQMHRAKITLARMLGCNPRQVDSLLKRAGGTSEPQFVDKPMKSIKQLQAIADDYDAEMKGFPKEVVSSMRHNTFPFQDKKCLIWALNEMHQGADISLRYRQANKWTVTSDTRVELQKKPKAEPVEKPAPLFELPPVVIQAWHWFVLKVEFALTETMRLLKSLLQPKKAAWVVTWVNGAIQITSTLKVEEDRLIETSTGEIYERNTQMTFDAWLASSPPAPEQIDEATEVIEHLPWLEDILDDLLGKEPDDGLRPPSGHRTSHEGDIRYGYEDTENPPGQQLGVACA